MTEVEDKDENQPQYWEYLFKTIKWMGINAFFGLFPLIFMYSIYNISDGKIGGQLVDDLILDGAICFVCIAIVGGVLGDYWLSGFRLNGFARFALYMVPAYILFVVSVNYYLIHTNVIDKSRFAMESFTTKWMIILSFVYTLFAKANLYMKEDLKDITKQRELP